MASSRKRPRTTDDETEAVVQQQTRVMNETNDAAVLALGDARKSWMTGSSRTGAPSSIRQQPRVGLSIPKKSTSHGQKTTSRQSEISQTCLISSSDRPQQGLRIKTSGHAMPTGSRSPAIPGTPQTPNARPQVIEIEDSSQEVPSGKSSNDRTTPMVRTYISQATSLPSPVCSTGISSPDNQTIPLPQPVDNESRSIDDSEREGNQDDVRHSNEQATGIPEAQGKNKNENERLQRLLHRFGGLEGLEKQLAGNIQTATDQANADPARAQEDTPARTTIVADPDSEAAMPPNFQFPGILGPLGNIPRFGVPALPSQDQNVQTQMPSAVRTNRGQPPLTASNTRIQRQPSSTIPQSPITPTHGHILPSNHPQQVHVRRSSPPQFTPQSMPRQYHQQQLNQQRQQPTGPPTYIQQQSPGQTTQIRQQLHPQQPIVAPSSSRSRPHGQPTQTHQQQPNHQWHQAPQTGTSSVAMPTQQQYRGQPITPATYQSQYASSGHVPQQVPRQPGNFLPRQYGTASPSLEVFTGWNHHASNDQWQLIINQLRARIIYVQAIPDTTPGKSSEMYYLSDAWDACQSHNVHYLKMFQTHAISYGMADDYVQGLEGVVSGLDVLRRVFGDMAQGSWFSTFPCQAPMTQGDVRRWFKLMQVELGILGREFTRLREASDSTHRLPSPDEISLGFPGSHVLQRRIFLYFLQWWWGQPIDQCYVQIEQAYRATQVRMTEINHSANAETARGLRSAENARFMQQVAMYKEQHRLHTQNGSGNLQIQQNNPSIGTAGSSPGFHQTQRRSRTVSGQNAPHQLIGLQQSNPAPGNAQAGNNASITVQSRKQKIPQLAINGPTNPSNEEIVNHIMQTANLNHGRLPLGSAFPTTSPPIGYIPFHHTLRRDPVARPKNMLSDPKKYRSYVSGFIIPKASKSLNFDRSTRHRSVEFDLDDEMLDKLVKPASTVNGKGPREFETGSQLLRLRGVAGPRPSAVEEWVTRETSWPKDLAILLNSEAMEFRTKPRHPKDFPVDVTSRVQPGTNHIGASFLWTEPPPVNFGYTIALEIVTVTDRAVIISKVSAAKNKGTEESLRKYFDRGDDDEVEVIVDYLDITVTDPFTTSLPTTPIRSIHCQHYQCFDLEIFIDSRPHDINKPDKFVCPICGVDARPTVLAVDIWMSSVIRKLRDTNQEDAKMITLSPDLSWVVKEEVLTGEASRDDEEENEAGRRTAVPQRTTSKVIEVIDLD